jgi:REP element-mobilizing transposase RayT
MARIARNTLPDGTFHVTARGAGPIPIVADSRDCLSFLAMLAATPRRFGWLIRVHCLMTTHYHVLVETSIARLSRGMHWLNGVYARRFNERHGRTGHLFGERFSSYVVESEEHFEAAYRYILENPVRAGLCAHSSEWPWCGVGAPSAPRGPGPTRPRARSPRRGR